MNSDTKLQTLFQVLRWCGAIMIVSAAGTFLVQSWEETGDVPRYLALLGTTALLPAVAYLCGVRFKEGRSARAMVLAFLGILPIHTGVLGGFVLSQFGNVGASIGPVAQWVAPSPAAAVLLVAGAGAVLAPLCWAAFRVLARPHAGWLAGASMSAHALLLVPSRTALAATMTIIPILAMTAWCAARVRPNTREEKLAVSSLLAPALIIAARQVLFYDVSLAFWAAILGASAAGLFVLGAKTGDATLERFALVPTLLSTGALMGDLTAHLRIPFPVDALSYGWLAGAALLMMAWQSKRSKRYFVLSTLAVNAVVPTVVLMIDASALAALQLIAVGLAFASFGFIATRRPALYAGIGFAGVGFLAEVAYAIETFEPSGWLALAVFGIALIALTAWLERRARAVRLASPTAKVSQQSPAALP